MYPSAVCKRAWLSIFILILLAGPASAMKQQAGTESSNELPVLLAHSSADAEAFLRTDLFFGTERHHLPPVSDDDWRAFLKTVISTRFPDGLTVGKSGAD